MKVYVVEFRRKVEGAEWEPIHASYHSRDEAKAERMRVAMANEHPGHEYRVRAYVPFDDATEREKP